MPTWQSFDAFGRDVAALARDLEREHRTSIALKMARGGQEIAERVASRDLGGDPKFSGWDPELVTEAKPTRDGAVLKPTRSSAGPWTVAERGRNQGGVNLFQGPGVARKSGRTSRTKSGGVRVRRFKQKRWNGYTRGKRTATKAVAEMDKKLPRIAEVESRKVIQRRFDVS